MKTRREMDGSLSLLKNNRNQIILWVYVLSMGFIVLPLAAYFSSVESPISIADLPELLLFSLIVWLFWIVNIEVIVSGFVTPVETTRWFLLTLFLLKGPTMAFLSYFLGTWYYSFFFKRAPIANLSTITDLSLGYGMAFLIVSRFFPADFQHPVTVFLALILVLLIATAFHLVSGAFFHSLRDQVGFKESFFAYLPDLSMLIVFVLVFPELSYITAVFWKAHFYAEAILLFIPFLLLRRAMQSALKAVEEIANTIEAIVTVIEAKDPYTHYHCNRVAQYATVIAKFCGLGEGIVNRITRAARLHDIGKIMLLDRVLKKDGRLTEEEYEHIKLHADPDKVLMNKIPDDIPLKTLIELGRHHHERYDGKGYPDRLEKEKIPIEVRVISMADAWDAMTSDRVYRQGLSSENALSEIDKYSGKQWDPLVVEAFHDAYQQGVLKEVTVRPDLLRYPQPSWKISPKPLIHKSGEKKIGAVASIKMLFSRYRSMIVPLFFFAFFFSVYDWPGSAVYQNPLIVFAGFAVLLELWEMKFLKFPRFSPADAVYLSLLFLVPPLGVFTLILLVFLVRIFYDRKVEFSKMIQWVHRLIFFGLSVPFFKAIGFSSGGRLLIPPDYFKAPLGFMKLIAGFAAWSILYALLSFILIRVETIIRRRLWRISWHFQSLKRSVFFEIGLVCTFALLFSSFSSINSSQFPYLAFSFAVILAVSYPLLEYFRKVIEGNAKTLEALAQAADSRFEFYREHTTHVTKLALEIGFTMGLSEEELETLQLSARIFGLGNVGIPDEILNKADSLTEEEKRLMRQHAEISGQVAAQYSFYKEEVPIIWSHHEWWDGSGYPSQLKGEQIPLGARILAVADSFCAMLSPRPYREALSLNEAFAQIKAQKGSHFDPEVVEAFRQVI